MISVTDHAVTAPETAERMRQLCVAHSARSRTEAGCVAHHVHVDGEDASRRVFLDDGADMEALKAHFALPESRKFIRTLWALSAAAGTMKIYSVTETAP